MLTVVTVTDTAPVPADDEEVISMASDAATAREHLTSDLAVSSEPAYRAQVIAWFDTVCTVKGEHFGKITNPDGTTDVWRWQSV